MKIRILGCSGGIGKGLRTTSMLVDDDILIDAGTGVGDLTFDELLRIDHVFVTHSHLDHIACIPLMVDTVGFMRSKPIIVYALPETISVLQQHIFNWHIWPDFTRIPDEDSPFMRFEPIQVGRPIIMDGREITPLPANHVVPAVGYRVDNGKASLVFSGDTTINNAFWESVNQIKNLRYLIIETAFCDRKKDIAIASKHLCPSLLAVELAKFRSSVEIFITHLKPGEVELTMQEISEQVAAFSPRMLKNDQIFEL